jgi:hypothetical protein
MGQAARQFSLADKDRAIVDDWAYEFQPVLIEGKARSRGDFGGPNAANSATATNVITTAQHDCSTNPINTQTETLR